VGIDATDQRITFSEFIFSRVKDESKTGMPERIEEYGMAEGVVIVIAVMAVMVVSKWR
jgi:hypothetical protein